MSNDTSIPCVLSGERQVVHHCVPSRIEVLGGAGAQHDQGKDRQHRTHDGDDLRTEFGAEPAQSAFRLVLCASHPSVMLLLATALGVDPA